MYGAIGMIDERDMKMAGERPGLSRELRALLTMSVPTVVITASRTVVSFTDMFMVSRLGTDAAAALMPANLGVFCLIALGMGTMTAVNTYSAQCLGRGRAEDAARYAVQALLAALSFGVLAVPLIPLVPGLVRSFGEPRRFVVENVDSLYSKPSKSEVFHCVLAIV